MNASAAAIPSPFVGEATQAHALACAILDKLSEAKREAFILAEFEGLTTAEIAALTDTKEETVWSRLHYARKEFAKLLEKKRLQSK